ncbi:RNA 2',3'-cyclic phosphodiesterase [Roseisolibacter sp. H3M3-2]|uniref:RNA 2',3'-cyclic phosphodiesterase n=1 Tax=Roseisolibacter sp. H3M3-2 TaxID=3031323 RepID=UPI0023D9FEC9|nr:RNA 2',3'-cyclic phosphodiesterase [Roseisolibacter sp. H3M3-2]MDF1504287.1 RNA 2',3'-cyclic phosphodiesterase [Roseisolibacter sp. H3M3-2]
MSEAPAPLRLFVALNLPDAVRAEVVEALGPLRGAIPPGVVSWVREPNLHLTLRFLGEVPAERAAALAGALDHTVADAVAPTLTLGGIGAFPTRERPRVLWVGVEMNVALAALYQKVDDLCDTLGFGRESRPYRPHLTVGRVRAGRRPPALDGAFLTTPRWSVRVPTVDLMSSELAPGGARYRVLRAAPLSRREDA